MLACSRLSSPEPQATALLESIREFAVEHCDTADAAHDDLHLRRVVSNAKALVDAEKRAGQSVDPFVVEAACWLHDIVQLPKGQGQPGEAERNSAALARVYLLELGLENSRVEAISSAIATHSYSGGLAPATIEAGIVQDADRLDAIGAVGIARFWITMQRLGGRMYHADEPLPLQRELDDRTWALDHIERKLLNLVALMNTIAGRQEAERRAAFLRLYREEFLREIRSSERGG